MVILVVSDIHCGSTTGLMPPEFTTQDEGIVLKANPAQLWLWEQGWVRSLGRFSEWLGDRPFSLVLNGDMIEGRHHGTMQLVHPDIMVHLWMANAVLAPIAAWAQQVFMVRGTECHARTIETTLGRLLGCVPDPVTGDYCWEQLQLDISDVRVHFKHHIPVSMRPWTRSGRLAAGLVAEQATAVKHGHTPPRVVVRSHAHGFVEYRGDEGLLIVTPPLQLMTRYARRVTYESLTTPGVTALDFDNLDPDGLPTVQCWRAHPDPDPVVKL